MTKMSLLRAWMVLGMRLYESFLRRGNEHCNALLARPQAQVARTL